MEGCRSSGHDGGPQDGGKTTLQALSQSQLAALTEAYREVDRSAIWQDKGLVGEGDTKWRTYEAGSSGSGD